MQRLERIASSDDELIAHNLRPGGSVDSLAEISDNAGKIAQHLHDDLKLANAEAVESRVTAAIDKQNTAIPNSKPGM